MKYSRAFKWVLIVLLPLTLSWKLVARTQHSTDLSDKEVQQRVAEFLARQYFAVERTEQLAEGQPLLRATAGPCQILVSRSPALGWDRELVRRYASGGDRIFVVFAGRMYSEQPTWLTVPDYLWARLRRELGFKAQASPVLSVVAKPVCEAERLPWKNLS